MTPMELLTDACDQRAYGIVVRVAERLQAQVIAGDPLPKWPRTPRIDRADGSIAADLGAIRQCTETYAWMVSVGMQERPGSAPMEIRDAVVRALKRIAATARARSQSEFDHQVAILCGEESA